MSPQQFVDYLNRAQMPRLGYELIESEQGSHWCWPAYDWTQHDPADFKGKDYIAAQRRRTGEAVYSIKYAADEATRRATR